jgi:two-component system, OmpR family, sensor histidine kinase MprB
MRFHRRLILLVASAVAVAIVVASILVYVIVRAELRGNVDSELRSQSSGVFTVEARAPAGDKPRQAPPPPGDAIFGVSRGPRPKGATVTEGGRSVVLPHSPLGGPALYAQFVTSGGNVVAPPGAKIPLAVTAPVRAVAAGKRAPFLRDAHLNGVHVRIYTGRAGPGQAIQAVRSLAETDATLGRLAWVLLGVSLGGIAAAALLGWLVSRAALSPVTRLTLAAEHVARTRDLSRRMDPSAGDEIGRLARAFNTMLAALDRSLGAQRQLVADASHELRTPLTSLRTNIDVLSRAGDLSPAAREKLLRDVSSQLSELSLLVGDLMDLARESEEEDDVHEEIRLDLLVRDCVARARIHAADLRFAVDARPCSVNGSPSRLQRAVGNLLDNAAKWSPPGAEVEVMVRGGMVRVRDHGPGIPAADLPHVFDRFYRSPVARGLPGSGLGLAIVRQVAEGHGGAATAANHPAGGASLSLELPELVATPEDRETRPSAALT